VRTSGPAHQVNESANESPTLHGPRSTHHEDLSALCQPRKSIGSYESVVHDDSVIPNRPLSSRIIRSKHGEYYQTSPRQQIEIGLRDSTAQASLFPSMKTHELEDWIKKLKRTSRFAWKNGLAEDSFPYRHLMEDLKGRDFVGYTRLQIPTN